MITNPITTTLAALAALALCVPSALADTVVSTNTTQNGGTFTVQDNSVLLVTDSNNDPTLSLINGATASFEGSTVIGSLDGESGNLEILGGSTLSNTGTPSSLGTYGSVSVWRGRGYLGLNAGSTGTATVTGNGSTWTGSSFFSIGHGGTGELLISNGGSVDYSNGIIGSLDGSQGSVTVTGSGSTFTHSAPPPNASPLTIGSNGTGELTIQNGGYVSSRVSNIGSQLGSQGTVTVSGVGSNWTIQSTLTAGFSVGSFGTGELTIEDGGSVTNIGSHAVRIGNQISGYGAVTVTGSGSTWTSSGSVIIIGSSGTGELLISDGGSVSNTSGILGFGDGANGTAAVTGAGSTWTNSGNLILGGTSLTNETTGTGTLTIADGGTVSVGGTTRIYGGDNASTLSLETGGTLNTHHLDPNGGNFNWTGGTLELTGTYTGDIAPLPDTGTLILDGPDASLSNTDHLTVGETGTGEMLISDGGSVTNTQGRIGFDSGSNGTVTVTGADSTWSNSSSLRIGSYGTGELLISGGGSVSNSSGYVGFFGSSQGMVTVTGEGSSWSNSLQLMVGRFGAGELLISDGGSVTSSSSSYIGYSGVGSQVTVTGEGSTWSDSGSLYVGRDGAGELTVENGGQVSAQTIFSGSLANFHGDGTIDAKSLIVDGIDLVFGSSASLQQTFGFGSAGEIHVDFDGTGRLGAGYQGAGSLTISDGMEIASSGNASLGIRSGSEGSATVTGEGSTWTNSGQLRVGDLGKGDLTIENGGSAFNTVGYIGYWGNSQGTVIVTGPGSTWTNTGSLILGGASLTNERPSTGTLTIADGGTVYVDGTTRVFGGNNPSTLNLQADGTLNTHHFDPTGGNFNWTGGTLVLTGTYTGSLLIPELGTLTGDGGTITASLVNAGLLSPGNSPGTVTVEGDFIQESTGILDIEIGGEGVGLFDLLAVTGDVVLDGSLNITFIDDFELGLNQFYQILTTDGTQTGQFIGLDEGGLVGTFNNINLFITYEPESSGGVDGVAVYSVPEPSSALLILLASGAWMLRRRYRNA